MHHARKTCSRVVYDVVRSTYRFVLPETWFGLETEWIVTLIILSLIMKCDIWEKITSRCRQRWCLNDQKCMHSFPSMRPPILCRSVQSLPRNQKYCGFDAIISYFLYIKSLQLNSETLRSTRKTSENNVKWCASCSGDMLTCCIPMLCALPTVSYTHRHGLGWKLNG